MTRQQIPRPEFSRPVETARIPGKGSHEKIAADAKECAALARRLDVPAVQALRAELDVRPWRGGGFKVAGTLTATLTQVSVISLEAFDSTVQFPVERYFLPSLAGQGDEDGDIDVIEGGAIDLGEVVAETLALELDPYPRKPGETYDQPEAAPEGDGEKVQPFARLKVVKPEKDT